MAESVDGKHAASDEYRRSFQGSRTSDTFSMACDYYHDPFCEVCFETRDRNVKHEGYCKDCVQFLCEDCLRVHRKLQGTRGHVIGKGDDMPKSMADKPPKFDYCDVHLRSQKDQFCGKHRILLCSQCVPSQHKNCPVKCVDDACKGVPSSEIDALYDKVNDFKGNLSSVVAQIDFNITELGNQKVNVLKDAQDRKEKSIAKIENLFEEITSEAKSKFKTNTSNLVRVKNNLNDVIVNLEGIMNDVDKIKGNIVDTKVFLKIHDILKDVEECRSDAEKLRPSSMKVKLSFIPDKRMIDFLSISFQMGSISLDTFQPQIAISVPEVSFPMSPARSLPVSQGRGGSMPTGTSCEVAGTTLPLSQIKATSAWSLPVSQICSGKTPAGAGSQVARTMMPLSGIKAQRLDSYNVNLKDDKSSCFISGIAITNNDRRLLADNINSKIKLFSRDMTSLCSLSLSDKPRDIAVTGHREAVVSCDDKSLLILDTSDSKISMKRTVKLPFTAAGIAPYKEKLVVTSMSTSPASVKLIDQSGKVYWSTDTDQQGQELFSSPWYVTCYDDGGSAAVIVSDWGHNTLTKLNADTGDVITRRQLQGKDPRGVTTDTAGNIYACYRGTNEAAVLTKDLTQEHVLLSERDGLCNWPQAIVHHAVDHQLLISYFSHKSCDTVEYIRLH